MGDDRLARLTTLGAVLLAALAITTADGDAFRIAREALLADATTTYILGATAVWAAAWALEVRLSTTWLRVRWGPCEIRYWRRVCRVVAIVAAGTSLVLLARTLSWGLRLDAPMVLYPARQFIRGDRVFYRDLVEFNQPATYVLYGLMDRVIDDELIYRLIDYALIAITGLASIRAFRMRNAAAAAIAVLVFVVTHLYSTGVDCLQREMFVLALSMITGALLSNGRWALAAAAAALACWMKFHAACLIAPFVWDAIQRSSPETARKGVLRFVAVMVGASAFVLAILAALGALRPWLEMVGEYLPLYGRMAGTWNFSADAGNLWTRRVWLFLQPREHAPLLGIALVPLLLLRVFRRGGSREDSSRPVLGFYVGALAYVMIQGTFWHYQSIPEVFAVGTMIGIAATDLPERGVLSLAPRVALAGLVAWHVAGPTAYDAIEWERSGRNEDAIALAEQLRAEVPRGEAVQPLETVTGVVDAMWRADVPLATSFVFDIVFYYRADLPVIARWRRRFIAELAESRPLYIIEAIGGYRARPYGPGSESSFAELDAWIRQHYEVYREQGSFRWWRRREIAR